MYRINELARALKDWQQATALKYASPSNPRGALGRGDEAKGALRKRGGWAHGGSMSLVEWSDSAFGRQSTEGMCRFGLAIGLMPSTLRAPCRILQWTSIFPGEMVKSSEIYALSKMVKSCDGW